MPYFAEIASPLSDGLKAHGSGCIIWTPEIMDSFDKIKFALCQDVMIYTPDYNKTFILQTDTSNVSMG